MPDRVFNFKGLTQVCILALALPEIIEWEELQTCTAAHHQGEAIDILVQPISLRKVNKEKEQHDCGTLLCTRVSTC